MTHCRCNSLILVQGFFCNNSWGRRILGEYALLCNYSENLYLKPYFCLLICSLRTLSLCGCVIVIGPNCNPSVFHMD
uniref:Uncharacterized protein n=1 Tax=Arundo donax TaxID=35708 RepID=A0A0A9E7M2_ARUDO